MLELKETKMDNQARQFAGRKIEFKTTEILPDEQYRPQITARANGSNRMDYQQFRIAEY